MGTLVRGIVAALVALAAVACSGGAEGDLSNAFLTAAEAAEDAGSARVEMTVEVAIADQDLTLEGEGEFDFVDDVGSMTMSASSGAGMPAVGQMELILDGEHMYVKGAGFDPALAGKKWGRVDLGPGGVAAPGQFNQDPTQYLEWLRGVGENVEEVGEEEIDGVSTTHYKADLPVDGIVEQAADEDSEAALRARFAVFGDVESFPVEVWVDDAGLPRRLNVLIEAVTQGGFSSEVTLDLFDYGVDVEIDPPKSYHEIDGLAG